MSSSFPQCKRTEEYCVWPQTRKWNQVRTSKMELKRRGRALHRFSGKVVPITKANVKVSLQSWSTVVDGVWDLRSN